MRLLANAGALFLAALMLVAPRPASALFHLANIEEVVTSYNGDNTAQFVEIRMLSGAQNFVMNSVLAAFDTSGAYTGDVLVVPGNVANSGPTVHWIMATASFQTASGLTADFTMPAGLPQAGMICWGAPGLLPPAPGSWDHTNPLNYVGCLAYNGYTGPTNIFIGTPTPLDGIGHSLLRIGTTNDNNADFTCGDPLTPTNNVPTTATLAATTPCPAPPTTTSTSSTSITTTSVTTSTSLPPPIADPLPPIPPGGVTIDLETVATGLVSPLGLVDDGAGRLFVYDQAGTVKIIQNGQVLPTPFLDVSARLVPLGIAGPGSYDERGLLGFALHPSFATNGKIYTYTSEPATGLPDFTTPVPATPDHQSVIAEWTVDGGNPNLIDTASRRELLRIDKPEFNHNAGTLRFGPDGYLYFTLGDGGAGDDEGPGHLPDGNAQDTGNIYGKVMRLDVGGTNSANGQYGIPADNPFVGGPGVDEIWAYGLRNPYAFSFDTGTGDLFLGDAGQNDIEEVDVITKGGNFGWRLKEGSFFFVPNGINPGYVALTPVAPIPPGLIEPIAEYDHDDGVVVIGGFVYRGSALPGLVGHYITGDFTTDFVIPKGRLFFLDASTSFAEFTIGNPARPLGLFLKGFGQDATGEVYVLGSQDLGPFGSSGRILRIVPLADHLLNYKAGVRKNATPPGTSFPSGVTKSIQDPIGTRTCGIKKEVAIYNPATKNGEPINANTHFVAYQLAGCPPMAPTTRTFTDQFFPGGIPLTFIRPSVLLVPSGKAILPAPTPPAPRADTDHYLCYKLKGPKLPTPITAVVTDEFTTTPTTVTLKKVTQICMPANKENEDPGAVQDLNRYVCYQAKLPQGVKHMKTTVRTNNTNFGANTLQSKSLRELCVPATSN
jgi:glucose/arabinose dehydrogenase